MAIDPMRLLHTHLLAACLLPLAPGLAAAQEGRAREDQGARRQAAPPPIPLRAAVSAAADQLQLNPGDAAPTTPDPVTS